MNNEQTIPNNTRQSSGLSEEAKEARKAYQRDYYKKNRDKVKSWQAGYWARKAANGSDIEVAED